MEDIEYRRNATKIPIRSHGVSVRGSVSLLLQLLIDFPGGREGEGEPAYGPTTTDAAAAPTLLPAAVETAQGKWQ